MFGPGGKPVLATNQANSVGPASRVAPSSNSITVVQTGFISGGSKQKSQSSHSTSGIGLQSTKPSSIGGINTTKNAHLARIPNASVNSAAPASHPPVLAQYGAQSLDNSQNNMIDASNAAAHTGHQSSGSASGKTSVAQRSLSRARQFGKDLTNMFSFTSKGQGSRQSSKGQSASQQ